MEYAEPLRTFLKVKTHTEQDATPAEYFVPINNATEAIYRSKLAFLAVGIFSGAINVLALTGPLYMLQVYDRVLPSHSVPTLIGITAVVLFLYSAFAALDFARVRTLSRIGNDIDDRLRPTVMQSVLLISTRTKNGTDATLPIRDLDRIRTFLSGLGPIALLDLPWLPFYAGLIYFLHPTLGLFAFGSAALLFAITGWTEFRSKQFSKQATRSLSDRDAFGQAAQQNAEIIQSMGMHSRVIRKWMDASASHLSISTAASDIPIGAGSLSRALRMFLQSGILGLGAYLAIRGEISAGTLIACSIILARALAPVELATSHWKGFVGLRDSVRRLNALLADIPPASQRHVDLPRPARQLEVNNIVIVPPGERLPTLSKVHFTLKAGDGLAVIGPSAAGKTTLLKALVGAWPVLPNGGDIRLDGSKFSQWDPEVIGRDIGYLPQDIELFKGTIAENIARLDSTASSSSIVQAASLANVHDMIVRLPEGYETQIGTSGLNLSAGQRQRLGLARALYGDPFLVVLDEPNSHLDSQGDVALANAVRSVRSRGGIVVVVTHRTSLLTSLNKALVLMDGRMQNFGPIEALVRSDATATAGTSKSGGHDGARQASGIMVS